MRIALGADHAGYAAKEEIRGVLRALGHTVLDVGTSSEASVDYPDFALAVSSAVARGDADRGVLICGTGIGMSIAANKVQGIRAAVVTDEKTAEMSRRHNDANVFCAGARTTSIAQLTENLKVWLETPFEGGRHLSRVNKIAAIEQGEKGKGP